MKCEGAWLSNREWIFVIILVILSQFLLHQYSSNMMNENQVINYISFSGTIVSIILAILAIVYSFFQSITQQSNSDKIASNVESLTVVASTVNTSVDTMIAQVDTLNTVVDDVRNLPSDIVTLVSEALEKLNSKHVVDIREAVSEYIERVKPDKDNDSARNQKINDGVVTQASSNNKAIIHNVRWSILTTTIAACIIINRTSVFDVLRKIIKGAGENKKAISELTILLTGAISEISLLKTLNLVMEYECKDDIAKNYYYVAPSSESVNIQEKMFTVLFVYYRDAFDDINAKLDGTMSGILIDALEITPEIKKSNKNDIVSKLFGN